MVTPPCFVRPLDVGPFDADKRKAHSTLHDRAVMGLGRREPILPTVTTAILQLRIRGFALRPTSSANCPEAWVKTR
jgi:hypothetical protein